MSDCIQPIAGIQFDRRQFLGACTAGMVTATAGVTSSFGLGSASPETASQRHAAPLAMWALTGLLRSADVCRQLDAFAAAGWGAVLYPRWGLELEYLSEAWLERIRYIVQQAAGRNMEIWLYDEFCWPSGHAKGLVTQDHPELEARLLYVEPDGRSRVETVPGGANMLMPEATQRFLTATHERYASAVGEHFGKTVRAIFTDEPSLALQHQPRKPGDNSWRLVWSNSLNRALGGDFRRQLAAAGPGVEKSPLWREYWKSYARVFRESWTQPIADWCREHNVALSGHLFGENDFGSRVANYGSLRRQLSEFHIPGIDEIGTNHEVDRCQAMTLATIAEYQGRERMCEVFALGPCHMHLETMRKMIDLCSACGVDRYVMAVSHFDLRGNYFNRKYLSVMSGQQPWFRDYAGVFAEYLNEVAPRARQAQPLGVPWPSEEELWAVAGPAPQQSRELRRMTTAFLAKARRAIQDRLTTHRTAVTGYRSRFEASWTFEPEGLNSLRIDSGSLTIVKLPSTAELSVQTQLVRGLRINGQAVDLDAAPADSKFDLSYRRLPVIRLLNEGVNTFQVETDESAPLPFLPALVFWGDFAVDASQRIVERPAAVSLGDWRSQGYPAFCGVGRYRTQVQWSPVPRSLGLESGQYPTRVLVNGQECGRRPWGPFEFDLAVAARPGLNEVVVEVASTIGHLFIPNDSPAVGLLDIWTSG